jgi:anti-sigma factor RsiW
LRLEGGISAAEPPRSAPGWLAGVAVVGALLAVGSLAVALFSLWSG